VRDNGVRDFDDRPHGQTSESSAVCTRGGQSKAGSRPPPPRAWARGRDAAQVLQRLMGRAGGPRAVLGEGACNLVSPTTCREQLRPMNDQAISSGRKDDSRRRGILRSRYFARCDLKIDLDARWRTTAKKERHGVSCIRAAPPLFSCAPGYAEASCLDLKECRARNGFAFSAGQLKKDPNCVLPVV